MAGVTVVFEAHELAELGRAMRSAAKALPASLMRDIADRGASETRQRIHDGGPAPDGTDWPERDARNPNDSALLNLSGALVESIDADAGPDTAIWGSNLVYARIHQLGGTIVPKHAPALVFDVDDGVVWAMKVDIPARPYLGYGAPERQAVEDVIEAWLDESLREGA